MRRLDYKRQLVDYFIKNISSKKYDSDTLRFALYNQGYSKVIVDHACDAAIKEMAKTAPILKEKPIIKHEIYDMNDNLIEIEPMNGWKKFLNKLKGNKI